MIVSTWTEERCLIPKYTHDSCIFSLDAFFGEASAVGVYFDNNMNQLPEPTFFALRAFHLCLPRSKPIHVAQVQAFRDDGRRRFVRLGPLAGQAA